MAGIIAIIPARMGSTRFAGKPLAPLLGRPMLEHVYLRAKMSKLLDEVYVATCDEEIRIALEHAGAPVIMTSNTHERASDRVAEAAGIIELGSGHENDIVVMIQGDEPMITTAMIDAAVEPMMQDSTIPCVNLVRRIHKQSELDDPNTIKVVRDGKGDALYFSRSAIPRVDLQQSDDCHVFKQVCVIPFQRVFLREFALLAPTPLEKAESIDMLRAIEHGKKIRLVETDINTHSVDTVEDLKLVESLMKDELDAASISAPKRP